MDLQPASIAQVHAAKSGAMVLIEGDVGSVVEQIQEVHPQFRVRYSEAGAYFVVYGLDEHGKEYLVTTAQELDGRLVQRIQLIASERYDFTAEFDRQDAAYEAQMEANFREQVGEIGERLAHAMREDRNENVKPITVSRGL